MSCSRWACKTQAEARRLRRGIGKRESKFILRSTGVFVAVGSGRFLRLSIISFSPFKSKIIFYFDIALYQLFIELFGYICFYGLLLSP